MIEALRVLVVCRKTTVTARRIALQMIQNTIVATPDGLRDQLRIMIWMQLVRTLAAWRPDMTAYRDVEAAYRISLKSLGRRYLELHDEIADLDAMIAAIVKDLAPNLVARNSISHVGGAQLLLTAGGNPERMRSEASFAALCGVSPVPASSGKTVRHRLNRGGDRSANSALPHGSPLDKQKGIQGSQYTSIAFGLRCKEARVRPSMGSVGDAYDNAMCESFFATLECELLDHRKSRPRRRPAWPSSSSSRNPGRRHSPLGYLSPVNYGKAAHERLQSVSQELST